MNINDFSQIRAEIADAVGELGLISIDGESVSNILWLQRIHQDYDSVYKVNVSPSFSLYTISGAVTLRKRNSNVLIEGLDPDEDGKVLISPTEFIMASIVPNISDRINHDGTIYNVSRITKLALSFMSDSYDLINDSSLLYAITMKEAMFQAQTTEYKDKADPYFNDDTEQVETFANASGANTTIYTDYPAEVKGTVVGSYEISPGFNDIIKVSVGTFNNALITISTGTVDVEYATATAMASYIQSRIVSVMGSNILAAIPRNGKVILQTIAEGTIATMELKNVSANPYVDFGWRIGVYVGRSSIALATSLEYINGDPING